MWYLVVFFSFFPNMKKKDKAMISRRSLWEENAKRNG